MKNLVFLLLCLIFTAQAQNTNRIFNSSTAVFPADSASLFYYVYSLSYDNIVFTKEDNVYTAGFDLSLEIYEGQNLVKRLFDSKNAEAADYEETINGSRVLKGMVSTELKEGTYSLFALVTDKNSGRELKLPPENLIVHNEDIRKPIIAGAAINCTGGKYPVFVNLNGDIPFSDAPVDIIISAPETTEQPLTVRIENNGKVVFDGKNTDKFISSLSLLNCGNEVVIDSDDSGKVTENYLIKNISKLMDEGTYKIEITSGDKKAEFAGRVSWVNKPISLLDPESAIKLLRFHEDEKKIKELLKNDDENYLSALTDYWKKYDPSPNTPFNPLMQEYYERIDYAARAFKPIGKTGGLNTDRASVYIKLGKPDKIERASNGSGKVVETWYYDKPLKKFIFIDKEGTGNYTLQSD